MDVFADKALDAIKEMPAFNPDAAGLKRPATRGVEYLTKEELRSARSRSANARELARSELEKEVSSIGLLGLIGSKTQLMDHEYIEDLLEIADLNDDHLVTVLAKLKSIQVPRHTTAGYILQYKKGADASSGGLKGGRQDADSDNEQIIKNIDPLETARTTDMKRVAEYEHIPSENPLAKLRSGDYEGKFRNAKDVVRVVQSHRRALQDCYKQELKINPKIYGKIEVRFTIDPEGKVIDASVVSSTLRSPGMEACIIHRIKNWRDFGFSDPAEGNITFKQSFNFGN
jgi:TonB family protein